MQEPILCDQIAVKVPQESAQRDDGRPHVVLMIARGEAVRNFLYSDTLRVLSQNARVTLLSVIHDREFCNRFERYTDAIVPLEKCAEHRLVQYFRHVLLHAHYRWLWSEKAKNKWEILEHRASSSTDRARLTLWKSLVRALATGPSLRILTTIHEYAAWKLSVSRDFPRLFEQLGPDLVFNCSHIPIHGHWSELPVIVAHRMGVPTATFIFSWDNLTTRSRILAPYDYYFVWHEPMQDELLSIYPSIEEDQVHITGTPQFDFHFKTEFWLSRETLCNKMGIDPGRPFVLYTTGRYQDFPEEHRHVETVIRILQEIDAGSRPQLVVRTYAKGTSSEMRALSRRSIRDVVFPPILWDEKWLIPKYEDLAIYTSLLRHTALGINAASTVSLELMMHDKPVINIGFDPPGSNLPHPLRWARHIEFDHYRTVADSGAVMVARSEHDMSTMIRQALTRPGTHASRRREFVRRTFGNTLDSRSGHRVAECLLKLAARRSVVQVTS